MTSIELPCPVDTPNGRSTVTFVAVAVGVAPTGNDTGGSGDRLILRLSTDNEPDRYAVFERTAAQPWCRVTRDLTAAELADWTNYRQMSPDTADSSFERWIEHFGLSAW